MNKPYISKDGTIVSWYCGTMVHCNVETVVLWLYGTLVRWDYGTVGLWYVGMGRRKCSAIVPF